MKYKWKTLEKEVFSVLRFMLSFEKQYELLTLNLLNATKI